MAEITYQMVLGTLQTISIMIGIIYYLAIMRNTQKTRELNLQSQKLTQKAQEQASETRQAQFFMQLYNFSSSKEFNRDTWELYQMEWTDFDDFAAKFDSSVNVDNFEKRYTYWKYYYGMGMLLKKGLVDIEMLYFLMGGYGALWMWEKFKDIIFESRRRMNEPDHFVMFEYLAGELNRMREQRGRTFEVPESWGRFTSDINR